jgi:hypothetical protein
MSTVRQPLTIAMLLAAALLVVRASAEPPIATAYPGSSVRVERTPVVGGGELFTFFKNVPQPGGSGSVAEVPFVSILRDTMGDDVPENDELRDVWALTHTRPSIWRRGVAAVPFLYSRAGSARPSEKLPAPLIDLARPAKGTIPRVVERVAQATVLDARGLPYRATSRAYRARAGEYRNMHLWRTLELLGAGPSGEESLSEGELGYVRGRVLLARNLLGGLVDDEYVAPAWDKFNLGISEARGHNWELLRQRAEENGLYFQPLELARNTPSFALLWMNQAEAGESERKFDSKFLGISSPFRDRRVVRWTGYSEFWQLDEFGSRVPEGKQGVREARMIPLALYSLEHPRMPLVIVDFRDTGKPKRKEMMRRATDDVATGVLGLTGFGNWTWLAVRSTASFVHSRRVAPLDRSSRVRAYMQVRQALSTDNQLAPELRNELIRRFDQLGLNPFDNASQAELEIARQHHKALLDQAASGGLREHLAKQRIREAEQILHSRKTRVLRRTASVASLGIYRHKEEQTPVLLHVVDRQRRIDYHRRHVEQALAAGPRPEIVMEMGEVRRSASELARLVGPADRETVAVQQLLTNLFWKTSDSATRAACYSGLAILEQTGEAVAAHDFQRSMVKTSSGDGQ